MNWSYVGLIVASLLCTYNRTMISLRHTEHNISWILICVAAISVLGWYTNTYTPDSVVKMGLFLVLIYSIVFFFVLFVLNNVRRAILSSSGVVIFLALRYLGLREIYFPLLLIAILILIDLYFSKQPKSFDKKQM